MTRPYLRKPLFSFVLALLLISCSAPKYVPKVEDIPTSTFGSLIQVKNNLTNKFVTGELIAIDEELTVILSIENNVNEIIAIPTKNIGYYKLRYAQPEQYGWSIPVYSLFTISHGYFAVITMPLNLLVTGGITASGANAYTYDEEQITLSELKMFARFPQGIPPSITYQMLVETDYHSKALLRFEVDETAGINGSFEVHTDGVPVNWVLLNAKARQSGEVDYIITTVKYATDGKLSLQIKSPAELKRAEQKPSLAQVIAVNPNSTYAIRFKVKGNGLVLSAKVGGLNDAVDGLMSLETTPKSDLFLSYELLVKTGPEQNKLRLEFSALTTGTAFLDALVVKELKED
jgi:hypothetical protein